MFITVSRSAREVPRLCKSFTPEGNILLRNNSLARVTSGVILFHSVINRVHDHVYLEEIGNFMRKIVYIEGA